MNILRSLLIFDSLFFSVVNEKGGGGKGRGCVSTVFLEDQVMILCSSHNSYSNLLL